MSHTDRISNRRGRTWDLLLVSALVLGLAVPSVASEIGSTLGDAATACTRTDVDLAPQWTNRGIFTDAGTILFVDSWDRELAEYDLRGHRLGSGLASALQPSMRHLQPVAIHPAGAGSVVQLASQDLVFLDRALSFRQLRNVGQEAGVYDPFAPASEAGSFFNIMLPLEISGNDLITCAYLKRDADSPLEAGFFHVPLQGERKITALRSFNVNQTQGRVDDPAHRYCQVLGPYIATVGGRSYILTMGAEGPAIHRVEGPADGEPHLSAPLAAFPEGFDQLPDVSPALYVGQDYETLMRQLQYAKVPVAVYGAGKHLFVLTRRPAGGTTSWQVTKIAPGSSPEEARVVGTVEIPTDAAHVFAVPGPRYWAFAERGPAAGYKKPHPIESLLLVPSHAILGIGKGAGEVCK